MQVQIPTVASLNAISAVDDGFAVAVGARGTVLAWDGGAWASVTTPATSDLDFVWAGSRTNIWAVGPGTILSSDGTTWSLQAFDGGTFYGLYGASDGVWAIAEGGQVLDLATTGWSSRNLDAGPDMNLDQGTWGVSRSDLWIANSSLGLLHVTDAGVEVLPTPLPPANVWGFSSADLFASGFHIAGPGPDQPDYGFVEHRSNSSWSAYSLPTPGSSSTGAIWGACDAETWITVNAQQWGGAATGFICRWTGQTCVGESLPGLPPNASLSGIAGSDHLVWTVGSELTGAGLMYRAGR